jgi:hypothetical protein
LLDARWFPSTESISATCIIVRCLTYPSKLIALPLYKGHPGVGACPPLVALHRRDDEKLREWAVRSVGR